MTEMSWYWCFTHQRAETADERDHPENALGPFESPEAARDWRERNAERAEKWKADDKAWDDDPWRDDDGAGA